MAHTSVLGEVNALFRTLDLTPEATALVAVARSLARRIDQSEGIVSGAVAAAIPGIARQLSDLISTIVEMCTDTEVDTYLDGLINGPTTDAPVIWPRVVNGFVLDHDDPVDPETGERLTGQALADVLAIRDRGIKPDFDADLDAAIDAALDGAGYDDEDDE
jgi:hypothetical protein